MWGHYCANMVTIESVFVVGGAILLCRNPLWSTNTLTQGHLMKIEWLITNVTAAGSPDRAERAILGVILVGRDIADLDVFVVGKLLCDVGTPLEL